MGRTMFHNDPIRYSPFRIRECSDADKQFPVQVQPTELGYMIVRPAQRLEATPLGQTPMALDGNEPTEEPKGTN